jgi:hypothetical protein
MKQSAVVLGVFLALMLAGCAHGLIGELPKVTDPANAAEITIVRPARFVGSGVMNTITLDGRHLYELASGEHVTILVPPGNRVVGVTWRDFYLNRKEQTVALRTEARKSYFLRLDRQGTGISLNRITAETAAELMMDTMPLEQ